MHHIRRALAWALWSSVTLTPFAAIAAECPGPSGSAPPGANTTDKAAPFFIDTTGLDFKTAPPTRDPSNPNYPRATELPDSTLPPAGAEGNFIIGPTHAPAPETIAKEGVPRRHGHLFHDVVEGQRDLQSWPDPRRSRGLRQSSIMIATTAPGDKSNMIVTTSHPGIWTRTIEVYVPANSCAGTEAPFIVLGDGGSMGLEGNEHHDARQSDPAATRAADGRRSRSAMAGRMHRVPSAAVNTTRCRGSMRSSLSARCCRWLRKTLA